MRILVTGGAGFIGSHVVDTFVAAGHQVAVIDDLSSGRRENLNPQATFYQLDVQDAAVGDVFRRQQPEVLCHHAAQMDVRRSVADPVFDARVNLVGLLNLMEHGRQNGLRRVLFASTGGAIYGEQDYFPANEEHPLRPLSPYGITKLATEKYLFYYRAVYGIEHVILRYANIYGPRQNPHGEAGVVAIFADKMLRGEQPVINGDGKQTRDYVYVGDVVRANVFALSFSGSDIFNIGTGVENDVNRLFRIIKTSTGSPCEERHGPAKIGEQMRSVIDSAKAKKVLGWQPTVDLEEGLRRTVEYFRSVRAGS